MQLVAGGRHEPRQRRQCRLSGIGFVSTHDALRYPGPPSELRLRQPSAPPRLSEQCTADRHVVSIANCQWVYSRP
jgi:hypothetical protein